MWKMQLLDEETLLIKYAHEDVVTVRCPEPNAQVSFVVIYNVITTEARENELIVLLSRQ